MAGTKRSKPRAKKIDPKDMPVPELVPLGFIEAGVVGIGEEAEEAAHKMMEEIDRHPMASSDVEVRQSIDFYMAIASLCEQRANSLRAEHEVH